MKFVVLYGPPAVGKLTVAQELAMQTNYKLFHGHLTWNAVTPIFEWGSASYRRVLPEVRRIMLEEAAQYSIDLIFTFVFSVSRKHLADKYYFQAVEKHGGEVCLVRLFASKEVTEQRVTNQSRIEAGKLHTVESLRNYHEKLSDLDQLIPDRFSLEVDTGKLSPQAASEAIVSHYKLVF